MTLSVQNYPHMIPSTAAKAVAASGLTVLAADAQSVAVQSAATHQTTRITWRDLGDAANQDDADMALIYAGIYQAAVTMLRSRAISEQGIVVTVTDQGTGGAMWAVSVHDAAGQYRRDLMWADEGMQLPSRRLAGAEASDIMARLAKRTHQR